MEPRLFQTGESRPQRRLSALFALLLAFEAGAVEIQRVAASAHQDGSIAVEVSVDNPDDVKTVRATVRGHDGRVAAECRTTSDFMMNYLGEGESYRMYVDLTVPSPRLWSCESPYLYNIEVALEGKSKDTLATASFRTGFRSSEIRPEEGFFVNGRRTLLKGVVWGSADAGDPAKIKGLNANAVRLVAEGDREAFLKSCDEQGVYVVYDIPASTNRFDEIAMRKAISDMVSKDANHVSIVGWSVSDGANWLKLPRFCRRDDFNSDVKRCDLQSRFVAFPGVTDGVLDSAWQPSFSDLSGRLKKPAVVLPLSMLGGDGEKGGAGLADFWRIIRKSARSAGAFVGKGGLETAAPVMRRIWADVNCTYASGRITFENRWAFTNLDTCKYVWKAYGMDGREVVAKGAGTCPPCGPGGSASVETGPIGANASSIEIRVTARDRSEAGHVSIRFPREPLKPGFGPIVAAQPKWLPPMRFVTLSRTNNVVVAGKKRRSPVYDLVRSTNDTFEAKWMMLSETSYKLDYKFSHKGQVELYGVEFALPEAMSRGVRWLGMGPGPVWANRTAGGLWGIWEGDGAWRGFISDADWFEVKTDAGVYRLKWVEGPSMFGFGSPPAPDVELAGVKRAFPELGFGVYSVIPAAPAGSLLPEHTGPAGYARRGDRETKGSIIVEFGE